MPPDVEGDADEQEWCEELTVGRAEGAGQNKAKVVKFPSLEDPSQTLALAMFPNDT